MRWENQGERTPEQRERDLTARQLARQAKISRKANGRAWYVYAASALCLGMALFVIVAGACGQLSAFIGGLLILVAAALVA